MSNRTIEWRQHFPLLALAAAVTSITYAPVTLAQAETASLLEEVVVTARRKEENMQDIPVAVNAMSEDYLRTQNIVELNDLGTHVPSMRISNAGTSPNEPIVSVRGQRPSSVDLSGDQAVPLYYNEVVLTPASGSNLALYDLSNVQVLKGPQGTLFGRNSTGGAVLLTPKRPGADLGGYMEVKMGNYNQQGFEGAVDLPASDTVQFRLSGYTSTHDGYQDNVADNAIGGTEFWDENTKAGRLGMNWDISDDLNNLAVVDYAENKMLTRVPVPRYFNSSVGGTLGIGELVAWQFNGEPLLGSIPSPVNGPLFDEAIARQAARSAHDIEADVYAKEKVRNVFFSNTTEYNINDDFTLKNVFGYRKVRLSKATDADGTALPMYGSLTNGVIGDVTLNPNPLVSDAEQYSNELQLQGISFDENLEWITGVYAFKMSGGNDSTITQILGSLLQETKDFEVENKAYGVFGEGTYTFTDQWSMTMGLRHSIDEREITVRNTRSGRCSVKDVNGVVLPNTACARTENETFEHPTGRVSLNYKPDDMSLVYGSISTGYRAGGFNTRGTDNLTLKPFDEETVITYEVGHKADWSFDLAEVRTNVAAYYQEYSDIQKEVGVRGEGNTFATTTINAAEAVIQGVEFDVMIVPTENLTLNLAYSYVDAYYKEWDMAKSWTTDMMDNSDAPFVYIPENSVTASVSYTLPVDVSLGDMTISASVYWQDDMVNNDQADMWAAQAQAEGWSAKDLQGAYDSVDVSSYEVWNTRFDWRAVMGTDFDVAVFVNNVTDEEYVVGGLSVPDSLGFVAESYGAPRTIGASMRYSF